MGSQVHRFRARIRQPLDVLGLDAADQIFFHILDAAGTRTAIGRRASRARSCRVVAETERFGARRASRSRAAARAGTPAPDGALRQLGEEVEVRRRSPGCRCRSPRARRRRRTARSAACRPRSIVAARTGHDGRPGGGQPRQLAVCRAVRRARRAAGDHQPSDRDTRPDRIPAAATRRSRRRADRAARAMRRCRREGTRTSSGTRRDARSMADRRQCVGDRAEQRRRHRVRRVRRHADAADAVGRRQRLELRLRVARPPARDPAR